MKKIPGLFMLLFLLAGCADHDDHNKGPYAQWERKKDADDDHDFFYHGWLNPNGNDQVDHHPVGIAGPPN